MRQISLTDYFCKGLHRINSIDSINGNPNPPPHETTETKFRTDADKYVDNDETLARAKIP